MTFNNLLVSLAVGLFFWWLNKPKKGGSYVKRSETKPLEETSKGTISPSNDLPPMDYGSNSFVSNDYEDTIDPDIPLGTPIFEGGLGKPAQNVDPSKGGLPNQTTIPKGSATTAKTLLS